MFVFTIGFCPDMTSYRGRHRPSNMSQKVIVCGCGAEILLIPDVKEMDRAIFYHAECHAGKEKDPVQAKALFEQIQNYLIKQVLVMTSEKKSEKTPSKGRK